MKAIFLAKKFFFVLFFLVIIFGGCFGGFVSAEDGNYGLDDTARKGFGSVPSEAESDVPSIIGKLIGAGLSFIGVLFFVLMIYGGFLWMTARGSEEQVKKAIDIITQAAIGLIIVATAYLITRFVGETLLYSVTAS